MVSAKTSDRGTKYGEIGNNTPTTRHFWYFVQTLCIMTDPKVKSIPSWQRQGPAESSVTSEAESTNDIDPEHSKSSTSRAALLEQATKFLEDSEIRDATTERKISFLESKGLAKEEIEQLLGRPTNEQAASSTQEGSTASVYQEVRMSESTSGIEMLTSCMQATIPLQTSKPSAASPKPTSATSSQPRDVPPIITYPEFLLHSQKPPPLITAQRLLTTLYAASGAAAIIYGTSEYLVSPMIESLTSARHSLFETATSNLDNLNHKLEGVVSSVPPILTSVESRMASVDEDGNSSVTSDPAELFHRDTGTQTSLPPSSSSSSLQDILSTPAPTKAVLSQSQQLQAMHSQISSILSTGSALEESDKSVENGIDELQRYLHVLSHGRLHGYSHSGGGKAGEKDDEIAKVKAEIRGIKGVLLSAKTFPAGGTKSRVCA